MSNLLTFVKDK